MADIIEQLDAQIEHLNPENFVGDDSGGCQCDPDVNWVCELCCEVDLFCAARREIQWLRRQVDYAKTAGDGAKSCRKRAKVRIVTDVDDDGYDSLIDKRGEDRP
jgi:hypothetical protein